MLGWYTPDHREEISKRSLVPGSMASNLSNCKGLVVFLGSVCAALVFLTICEFVTTHMENPELISLQHRIQNHKTNVINIFKNTRSVVAKDFYKLAKAILDPAVLRTKEDIICVLRKIGFRTLTKDKALHEGARYYPKEHLFEGQKFKTCAVVMNSASLLNSSLGSFIDSHDIVMRLNKGPTTGFEKDVGSKTDIRILNSMLVGADPIGFLMTYLYRISPILVYEVPFYNTSLEEMLQQRNALPFKTLRAYEEFRKLFPNQEAYFLDPPIIWELWKVLVRFNKNHLIMKPPTTGFLGIFVLMNFCDTVNIFEFIPSLRLRGECYYWKERTPLFEDYTCTFGKYHSRSLEKLLILELNEADDFRTFFNGYTTVKGLHQYPHACQ